MRSRTFIVFGFLVAGILGTQFAGAGEDLFDAQAAAVHREKGISLLKAKNYKAAAGELEEAVSINPDAEAYYYLGYAYYLQGRAGDAESRKRAIECFDRAYELNPNYTPIGNTTYGTDVAAPDREKENAEESPVAAASVETGTQTAPADDGYSGKAH